MEIKKHSVCKTKLEKEYAESPMGYFWWWCPECKKRIPKTEIEEEDEKPIEKEVRKQKQFKSYKKGGSRRCVTKK